MKIKVLSLAISTLVLSACGGSSESSSPSSGSGTDVVTPSTPVVKFDVKPVINIETLEDASLAIDIQADKIPDGSESVVVEIVETAQLGSISVAYPSITYTPNPDVSGSDSITFKLKKGDVVSDLVKVNVAVVAVNDAPLISGSPQLNLKLDDEYNFKPSVQDVDSQSLAFSIENKPAWATFDSLSGALTGKPTSVDNIGTVVGVKISVSDGQYSAALPAFDITVQSQPWTRLTTLPADQGSHLNASKHENALFTLSHDVALASSMSCANVPSKQPMLSRFDVATGTWSQLATPPLPRYYFNSQWVGDKLYVFGGTDICPSGGMPVTKADIYDGALNSWSSIDSPSFSPFGMRVTASCSQGQDLFVFSTQSDVQYINTLNTSDNSWTSEALAEGTPSVKECFTHNNTLEVITSSAQNLSLGQFDLVTKAILNEAAIPNSTSSEYFDVALSADKLYFVTAKATQVYDYGISQWQSASENPFAVENQAGQLNYLRDFKLVGLGDRVLSVGGSYTTQPTPAVYQYLPAADH
ncbi:Ig-like domain-containing protein [Pseudoalteromonas xiamenensis]|uniref:Uncharacterized protein n=1 Tax=Pseudoalteromonas xiamenensis TaxID=882626 RepID=A0A975HLJ3_9GAMM|nr:Ig-like domain-containing protein [Pseudoalteromonas xiamenensis]QTH72099.1 hypothetical protein J5O05_04185 [Pseudoalteromonas xiamenensis]